MCPMTESCITKFTPKSYRGTWLVTPYRKSLIDLMMFFVVCVIGNAHHNHVTSISVYIFRNFFE